MLIYQPSEALRRLIKHFLVIEAPDGQARRVLPDTSLVAAIRFKGDCRVDGLRAPAMSFAGLRDSAREIVYDRGAATILAVFTPTGAAAFARTPPEMLFNSTTAMEEVVGTRSELALLRERIEAAAHHRERVGIFENFLLSHRREAPPDPLISAAVARIEAAHGNLRMDDLVRMIGLSQSALERRFRRFVGTTPKKFSSIVRLRRLTLAHPVSGELTATAHAAGFYDQAHFIKHVKRFTGATPSRFFQQREAFC